MAWEVPLGVRWLGWTVLFGLLYQGGGAVAESTNWGRVGSFLIPMVVAFVIGVHFRSRWWALGPLVAVSLVFAANWSAGDALPWLVFFVVPIVFYASLFSYAAFVGVRVGEAMHDRAAGSRHSGSSSGAPTRVPLG